MDKKLELIQQLADKWVVAFEDKEQELEFKNDFISDLKSLLTQEPNVLAKDITENIRINYGGKEALSFHIKYVQPLLNNENVKIQEPVEVKSAEEILEKYYGKKPDESPEAHNLIDLVEFVLAQQFTQPKDGWISVYNKLPNEGEEVVVCFDELYTGTAIYQEVGVVSQFVNEGYDEFSHERITHWQPLPNAPKK